MTGHSGNVQAPGAWLRRQREASGLTQEELADRSGLSARAIRSLERDRTRMPHPHTIELIAGSLGLTDPTVRMLIARYRAARYVGPELPAGDGGNPPAGSGAIVPRQLPLAVASFTGRTAELATLDDWLDRVTFEETAGAVAISAIGGMAGVGKTALALHWAHRVAGWFPDGQLYINLRGFDPGGQPADPGQVVRGFLHALGIAPGQIPAGLDGQMALYRSVLAGRRILIVADNVLSPAQVRPLLPGTPGSMVLVTSRTHLGGLAAAEGARTLNLDVLTEADAADLLSARLDPGRAVAEPSAVAELIRLCGGLPLALAIVAARAEQSRWPLAVLARQLAGAGERLGLLDLGDPAADVRTVFSWSSRQLTQDAARMFRLLEMHPGPDISVPAAASLAGVPAPRARALLAELAEASMATEGMPGRYLLHDLLRAYAAGQAPEGKRSMVTRAMYEHYLHTALAAAHTLDPSHPATRDAPEPGVTPEAVSGSDQALAWFDAEHDVLLAIIAQAADTGSWKYAQRIAQAMEPFLWRHVKWLELAATQQTAHACSEQLADPAGQARAHLFLAHARMRVGSADTARVHLAQAIELSRAGGDHATEARAYLGMGWLAEDRSGLAACLRALELAEAAADPALMAKACNNAGYCHALHGDASQALAYASRALDLCRTSGADPYLEALIEDTLGHTHRRRGNQQQAAIHFRLSLDLFQASSARYASAQVLINLGDCHHAAADPQAAGDAWHQALNILDDLSHPDADQVRNKISSLLRRKVS